MNKLLSSVLSRFTYREELPKLKVLFIASVLSYSAGVSADDTDIFFSAESSPPNILFVLDNSGSMSFRDGADDTGPTRMEKVQSALRLLVTALEGVNVGIVEFESTPELTVPIGDIEAIEDDLLDAIDAMVPAGATGTQTALWHGRDYLRGQLSGPTGFYQSPINHECQANHIIVMTDGQPTALLNIVDEVESVIDGGACDEVRLLDENGLSITNADGTPVYDDSRKCGQEIAEHLFKEDLSPINGINNAHTHTIGFNFSDPWLESIASAGSGTYFEVESAEGLVDAIRTIIEGIGTTFAAPTAPVNSFNESRHSGELYFEQFLSSESVRWNGNIKKYTLSEITDDVTGETQTVIVDANNIPLLDDAGSINASSQSLWSATADGASIPQGGFAHKLPDYTDRHWYTDDNSANHVTVKVTADELDTLPPESLGAADETERDTLVSWALGRDAEGFDELVAAAAIDAQDTANAAAAAAAVVAAETAVAAEAAALVEADAIALESATRTAADNAENAYNDAVANNTGDPVALFDIWQAADGDAINASAAATIARADADAARQAESDAAVESLAAANDASLSIAAAVEANDENHNFVADSLHNSPLVASYWAISGTDDTTPGEVGEILYSANNMGVLHAIDPETGIELWSYTPEEHLGNIKKYFDNEVSSDHVYGLDGEFTLHTTRIDQPDYDFYVDNAWLYMTERRGGNRVYALDVSDGLTDPSLNDPFSVMWKITGGDGGTAGFADLAQTWSKPQMVSVQYNCPDDCQSKDLLMFSGGYNASIYDEETLDYSGMTVPEDSHGNAVYFVDPATGALEWSVGNGTDHKLNLTDMNHSIPSTPVPVDTDLDGYIDLLFFVDIGGDVWRVDFGSEGDNLEEIHVAGGKIAELSPAGQSLRFFNPIDVVISGTNISTAFFSLVTGSGMRSSPLYEEPNLNRLYAIKDRWVNQAPFRFDASGDKQFDYRYVTDAAGDHSVITASEDILKNVSDTNSTTTDAYGFFRTFQLGEKILQPTLVTSNLIFANSYVPPVLMGGANCNFDIGNTRLYITSLVDGESSVPDSLSAAPDDFIVVGKGLLASGQIIDTGQSGAPLFLDPGGVTPLKEITNNEAFRRFRRTGWVELDEN